MTPRKKTIKAKSTKRKSVAKKKPAKQKPVVKKVVEEKVPEVKVPKIKTPSLLRGMKDIQPKDWSFWKKMYHTAEDISDAYGFGYISTPVMEDAGLFIRSIGRGTDIIDKEMYVFEDRDGSKVGLRPEFTAGVARAYIGHGMHNQSQPVKLWSYGPLFRHDRPQAGRYRQLHQFNCESYGAHDPVIDAELISVAYNFLRDLGIESNVHINSIGSVNDRQNYIIELVGYLRSKRSYLCEYCKKRINKNPLRVLDCKNEQCQQVIGEAPQIIDWLSEQSKDYFMKVLEYLDELEIPYVLRSTLVRGLDYYTETVFELYEDTEEGSQSALCGGGRYDLLIEQLGGNETPACGFAVGLERVAGILKRKNEENPKAKKEKTPKVFFAQLGEQARRHTLRMIEELRRSGMIVRHNLGKSSLKGQLEEANKCGVTHALILGQKEVQDETVIIRDMDSGIQEIVDQKKLRQALGKKLRK